MSMLPTMTQESSWPIMVSVSVKACPDRRAPANPMEAGLPSRVMVPRFSVLAILLSPFCLLLHQQPLNLPKLKSDRRILGST